MLIAGEAFDAKWIIAELNQRGAKLVISRRPKRLAPLDIDRDVYKWRHLIENIPGKEQEFKRTAGRSDKTDTSLVRHDHLECSRPPLTMRRDSQQALAHCLERASLPPQPFPPAW
jgi:hypothetical protein